MITWVNSGIGKDVAIRIVLQGHHTVLTSRNPEKGKVAFQEIKENIQSASLEFMIMDISLQSLIREIVKNILNKYDKLNVLINNACIFVLYQLH